jgi:hypothetical protein
MQTKPPAPKEGVLKRLFRSITYYDEPEPYRAGFRLVALPLLLGSFFAWREHASFLELFLIFVFVELGARLWDLQHKSEERARRDLKEQLRNNARTTSQIG